MKERIVVVGAGHAAGHLVVGLRQQGHQGAIQLIGEEPWPPYQRPPLSKAYLAGEVDEASLAVRRPTFYAKHTVDLVPRCRVALIDREARLVRAEDGRAFGYDRLALTTGGRVRRLAVPGAELDGVCHLRTIADVQAIRARLRPGVRLVVVGGGYIGLEVAAVTTKLGFAPTVLEMAPRLLERVTSPTVADFLQRVHEAQGVTVRTGTTVVAVEGVGRVRVVVCADGSRLPADLVVVGIGIVPNQELAAEAGLAVDDGIVVDELARTTDPQVVAAGDCTRHPSRFTARPIRLESVQNAQDQAKTAAATLCGKTLPHRAVPWFWSDQYDLKWQIAGLAEGHDQVLLRGDPADRAFAAFYLRGGRLLAVDALNRPAEYMWTRRVLAEGRPIDAGRLADPDVPLASALAD